MFKKEDIEELTKTLSDKWDKKNNITKPSYMIGIDDNKNIYITSKDDSKIFTFVHIEKNKKKYFGRAYMIPGKYTEIVEDKIYNITRQDKLILVQCSEGEHIFLNKEHRFVLKNLVDIVAEKISS